MREFNERFDFFWNLRVRTCKIKLSIHQIKVTYVVPYILDIYIQRFPPINVTCRKEFVLYCIVSLTCVLHWVVAPFHLPLRPPGMTFQPHSSPSISILFSALQSHRFPHSFFSHIQFALIFSNLHFPTHHTQRLSRRRPWYSLQEVKQPLNPHIIRYNAISSWFLWDLNHGPFWLTGMRLTTRPNHSLHFPPNESWNNKCTDCEMHSVCMSRTGPPDYIIVWGRIPQFI